VSAHTGWMRSTENAPSFAPLPGLHRRSDAGPSSRWKQDGQEV